MRTFIASFLIISLVIIIEVFGMGMFGDVIKSFLLFFLWGKIVFILLIIGYAMCLFKDVKEIIDSFKVRR